MDLTQLTELVAFYGIAVVAVFAALMVISQRSAIFSAIYLVLCFFCVAALYVLLHAHFLAVIQVLVYAGAIMVLFVMIIMLLNLRDEDLPPSRVTLVKTAGTAGALLVLVSMMVILQHVSNIDVNQLQDVGSFGTTQAIGRLLFTKYLLAFEVASILLLAAVVGALVMAGRIDSGGEDQ